MALKAFEKEIGTRLFAPCNKSASSTKKMIAIGLMASCDKSIFVLDGNVCNLCVKSLHLDRLKIST